MEPVREGRARVRLFVVVTMAVALIALAVAWSVTPLAHLLDPAVVAGYEREARALPFAAPIVIALFVVAGLAMTPATLLIGATVLLFGAWPGGLYAYAGMLTSAVVLYAIGRYAARDLVDRWLVRRAGSSIAVLHDRIARRGLISIALLRLTPLPFTIQNVMAGAARISVVDFVVGTGIGILPVIALMGGLAAGIDTWLERPDAGRLAWLIGAGAVLVAAGWTLRRWAVRHGGR